MAVDLDIEHEQREAIGKGLSQVLADTYTLYLKTHGYHWNVTGPQFAMLHAMFEEQYRELWTAADEIAERIRVMGVFAPGSGAELSALTSLKEAQGVPQADAMVADLAVGHEQLARTARAAFAVAETAEDQPTMDLLTERMTASEKFAWMLRAQLA